MEFTDLGLTGFGGSSILAHTARRFELFRLLGEAVSVKVRDRGASDAEMLWSMIASLARGHGALSDLDALRADTVACALLGLERAPESRRGRPSPRRRPQPQVRSRSRLQRRYNRVSGNSWSKIETPDRTAVSMERVNEFGPDFGDRRKDPSLNVSAQGFLP